MAAGGRGLLMKLLKPLRLAASVALIWAVLPFSSTGPIRSQSISLPVEVANARTQKQSSSECCSLAPTPAKIALLPGLSIEPPGSQHATTAIVESDNGDPISGAQIRFEVSRSDSVVELGQGTTDAEGRTSFTYQGPEHPADDLIAGCTNKDGTSPRSCTTPGVVTGQALVLWRLNGRFVCRASAVRLANDNLGEVEPFVSSESETCGASKSLSRLLLGPLESLNEKVDQTTLAMFGNSDAALITLRLVSADTTETVLFDFAHASATSDVERFEVQDPAGNVIVGAALLSSAAQVHCPGLLDITTPPAFSASSAVGSLTVLGTKIAVDDDEPADIPVPGFGVIHLNKETVGADGTRLTRTALIFEDDIGLIGNVVVAESAVGIEDACPISNVEPGPRGFDLIRL
jgi:hypothetical protein